MPLDRATLLKLMGPLPTPVPLEPQVLERVDCGTYWRELVEYAVAPGERIRAYFLLPKESEGKVPLVFCHHQHNREFHLGKSEIVGLAGNPDQATGPELAARGYAVIAPDAIAFEDRNWSSPTGHAWYAEYWELANRLVRGETLLAKILNDMSVGLDYGLSRREVDAERVGFLGHSYGGRMALWSPAFDSRIKVSVSNCGCVSYRNSLRHDCGVQAEFCVPDILRHGDIEDVVRAIAPRPLLIQATTDDVFSDNAHELYDSARPAFPPGSLQLRIWPGKHEFRPEMRENAYHFLDEHLGLPT